jgi:hypothetical protein
MLKHWKPIQPVCDHFVGLSIIRISLAAIDGRPDNKIITNELSYTIDAGSFDNGIYLLVAATADGKLHTGKFVKNYS